MIEVNKNTEISIKDPYLRRAIYDVFDGKCFYTGRELGFDEIEIDHIIPKSKGGKNCISNYVLSCHYINNKKLGIIYDKLIKITIEVVNEFFVDKVVDRYNVLKMNHEILETHIEINTFIKDKLKNNNFLDYRLRSYVRVNLTPIKIYPIIQGGRKGVKPKLFYDKMEIEVIFKKWMMFQ